LGKLSDKYHSGQKESLFLVFQAHAMFCDDKHLAAFSDLEPIIFYLLPFLQKQEVTYYTH
jgi:hypothetical protein